MVARYGGEEFCVLLPETELLDVVKMDGNIRLAFVNTQIKRSSDQQEICRMTIFISVARYQLEEPMADWFECADSTLYRSKNDARNRVTFLGDDCSIVQLKIPSCWISDL